MEGVHIKQCFLSVLEVDLVSRYVNMVLVKLLHKKHANYTRIHNLPFKIHFQKILIFPGNGHLYYQDNGKW